MQKKIPGYQTPQANLWNHPHHGDTWLVHDSPAGRLILKGSVSGFWVLGIGYGVLGIRY